LSSDLKRGAKQRRLAHHGPKQCGASNESEVIEPEMPSGAFIAFLCFSPRPSLGPGFRKIGRAQFESVASQQSDAAGTIGVEVESHFTCADFQFGHELGITEELFNNGSQEPPQHEAKFRFSPARRACLRFDGFRSQRPNRSVGYELRLEWTKVAWSALDLQVEKFPVASMAGALNAVHIAALCNQWSRGIHRCL
jgi:hypothetical protein